MLRRLLVLVFTVSVAGNALAAAARVGNDECGGCCRPAYSQQNESLSIGCCYSECGDPGDSRPTSPKGVPGVERIYKIDAPVAAPVVDPLEGRCPSALQTNGRTIIQSTHIYLRTGTLLI